jgi:hypothetical protein
MEDRMDHLMLLGGEFLQARNQWDRNFADARSQKFWDDLDQIGCGVFDAYGFAAQLAAGLFLIGMFFGILSLAALSADEIPPTACFDCTATGE